MEGKRCEVGEPAWRRGAEKERERKKVHRAIYSNLTLDSMALNNRPRLRRNWSPFNNGLLSNELVLSAKRARLGSDITPRVSRCCDSKEVEINLSYNHFFCGPRPTTGINQISSFPALSFARFHALSPSLPAPFRPCPSAVFLFFFFFYAARPPASLHLHFTFKNVETSPRNSARPRSYRESNPSILLSLSQATRP